MKELIDYGVNGIEELLDELNEFETVIKELKKTESDGMHIILPEPTDCLIEGCEFYLEQTRDLVKYEIDQDASDGFLNNAIGDNVRLNQSYIYIFYSIINSLKNANTHISNLTERISILEKNGVRTQL
jgi:hypothetical protein